MKLDEHTTFEAAWERYGDNIKSTLRIKDAKSTGGMELSRCLGGKVCGPFLVRLATEAAEKGLLVIPPPPEPHGWIPVGERLPDIGGDFNMSALCILISPEGPSFGKYCGPRAGAVGNPEWWEFIKSGGDWVACCPATNVKFWQPLPALPV